MIAAGFHIKSRGVTTVRVYEVTVDTDAYEAACTGESPADSDTGAHGGYLELGVRHLLPVVVVASGLIWWKLHDVDLGCHSTSALILGVVLSLVVGVGLMFLVFYSARNGHDDYPR